MTTTSRTALSPVPDDPRLTAYVSGDLSPGEAETFAREVAADAATQAEVDRTRQFVAVLEDALTSELLPEPPHDTDVPLPRCLREQPVMRRRLSVFPGLASALAIAACLIMVAALLLPTVGRVRESSKRMAAASNIRQIGQASLIYAMDHDDRLPEAANLHEYALQLAVGGGLDDASMWISGRDEGLPGARGLSRVRASSWQPPPSPTGDPAFLAAKLSIAVPLGGIMALMPSTTPIAWTRGLQPDGTWAAHSPFGTDGGHIVFLGGDVRWFRDLKSPARQLERFDGKGKTSNILEALPPGTRIGEYTPTAAETAEWSQREFSRTGSSSPLAVLVPVFIVALIPVLVIGGFIYLRVTGRIDTLTLIIALIIVCVIVLMISGFAGRVRDG